MKTLKQSFFDAINFFSQDPQPEAKLEDIWESIVVRYAESHRHYHTMKHLEDMYSELHGGMEIKEEKHWSMMILALVYHDAIYQIGNGDNELDSADLLESDLYSLNIDKNTLFLIRILIRVTKHDQYIKKGGYPFFKELFEDSDLTILGKPEAQYLEYVSNIEKEYHEVDPDDFNRGRILFIESMLSQEKIFYTDHFKDKYETQARINLVNELMRRKKPGLSPEAALFVFSKGGKIKVLGINESKIYQDLLKKAGWAHTATLDPALFIEYLGNECTSSEIAVEIIKLFEQQK